MLHLCAGASPLTCRRATRPVLVQAETAPDSEVEFEQLLLSAPNSSFVWVKYLAFLVSLGEMDRARQLAERALATIHYRCGPAAAGCAARWCLLLAAPSRGCMVMLKAEPPAAQLLSCGRWAPLAALTAMFAWRTRIRNFVPLATAPAHCSEEQEKFNIWVAWLNMENLYGSEEVGGCRLFDCSLPV